MGVPVVSGASMACSFGSAPAKLNVLPIRRVTAESKPMANINDFKAAVNIAPFGVCASLANPATASLTSAAFGVLTPGACAPDRASLQIAGLHTRHTKPRGSDRRRGREPLGGESLRGARCIGGS